MGITVSRANLLSRSIRAAVAGGDLTRKLNLGAALQSNSQDGSGAGGSKGGIIASITPFFQRFKGFLSGVIQGVTVTVSSIFGLVVSTTQSLATFDWNSSDKEIGEMIKQNNIQVASYWGGAIGSGVGWVAGIGVGYGITLLCPVIGSASLAKLVAGKVSLEAAQEVGATVANALRTTTKALGTNIALGSYRRFRKLFGVNPPDEAPSWTISGQIEEKIDSIKNPLFKAFVEEFTDEFFDSFIEAGYVFAYELDSQIAAAKAAKEAEAERSVKIIPDIEAPQESIILSGPQSQLQTAIQTTLVQYRFVHNRDVGQIVGMPAEDWYRAKPLRRKLVVVFLAKEQPPFVGPGGKRVKSATYSIPDPKAGLSWTAIKRAAKPYNWGRYRCTANLTNGRQMAVYGASPAEAEDKLRELLALSTCEISTLSVTEEKDRNPKLKKDPVRMYPAYGTALVRRATTDTEGRSDMDGNTWDEEHVRFELWTKNEPKTFKNVKW